MCLVSYADPVLVEVIRHCLLSAAREMFRNLIRTSYNTIIYEIHDFGLGIYDHKCRLLAEAPGLAVFTRGNDFGLRKMVEFLGRENLCPGDLILLNYPYWSSAHILDVLAVSPIFHEDTLVGYTAVKQHWLDLAQKDAGYCLDTTEVFQEGLILPCSKIYEKGVLNREVLNLIRFNTRMPERVIGDMNAQISSCRTGERRVQELVARYGLDAYHDAVEAILDHGERLARAGLARLPKGTWTAHDFLDDDGVDTERRVKMQATVSVTDEKMTVDWSGSDSAVKGPINLPIGSTMGISALVFKAITTPDTPANEGNFRPLEVLAPPGCVMHAQPPAPTFTLWTSLLAPEVITKALAQGMPDLIPACSGGDVFDVMGVGLHPDTGDYWLEATNEGVGFGAHADGDGETGIMHLSEPGCRNNPIEVLETKAPWLIEEYCIRRNSGGAGLHRGGLGITRRYRFLAAAACLTLVKKTKTRPWGMAGGHDGESGYVVVRPGTDQERITGAIYEHMEAGDVLVNSSGGGGGWGDPATRNPQAVQEDVRLDYVSWEVARSVYRVVLNPKDLSVDEPATVALRSRKT